MKNSGGDGGTPGAKSKFSEVEEEKKEVAPVTLHGRSTSATAEIKSTEVVVPKKKLELRQVSADNFVPSPINENNNNESYISSVGDSADSASNVHGVGAGLVGTSSPKSNGDLINSARKSGKSEDRKSAGGGGSMIFSPLIESAVVPTLDHEIRGAYQLENDKSNQQMQMPPSVSDAELANSQMGSEGGLTLNLPMQTPPREQLLSGNLTVSKS